MGDDNKEKLHTKDAGYIDSEGYLYMSGHRDKMVKNNGVGVELESIENQLEQKMEVIIKLIMMERKYLLKE